MVNIISIIMCLIILLLLVRILWRLKQIGEEINLIENWKGIPVKHYF